MQHLCVLSLLAAAGLTVTAAPADPAPTPSTEVVAANPAPAPSTEVIAADLPPWTIKSFTRTCDAGDTICTVSFAVETNDGVPPISCAYNVTGSPASQTHTQGIDCGPYMVGSNWSDQFGPGNGFTVFPILNFVKNQLAFPAYADTELVNGVPVSPDKSYPVQQFPPRG